MGRSEIHLEPGGADQGAELVGQAAADAAVDRLGRCLVAVGGGGAGGGPVQGEVDRRAASAAGPGEGRGRGRTFVTGRGDGHQLHWGGALAADLVDLGDVEDVVVGTAEGFDG